MTQNVPTPRVAGTILVLAFAAVPLAVAEAQTQPAPAPRTPPSVVDVNPCPLASHWHLRCPDLRMKRPFGVRVQRTHGHTLLRAGNSIDSVGAGPAELRGVRTSRRFMRAPQRIYKSGGGHITARTGARLKFAFGHAGRHYWKFYRAARFELWRLDKRGRRKRRVRRGVKISYCLRDLRRTHGSLARAPRRRVYPACSTNFRRRRARVGTSVGWSDIYPPTYVRQWIEVTGLRGCFALVHIADPGDGIFESNERNNRAQVIVRLPFRRGRQQRCPGRSTGETNHETGPY
jgi:Lysyl oxidase